LFSKDEVGYKRLKFPLTNNPSIGLNDITKNLLAIFRVKKAYITSYFYRFCNKNVIFSKGYPYNPLKLYKALPNDLKRSGEIEVLRDSKDEASLTKRPKQGS
ncbi:hypothetical protein CI238_12422, partial [Colletotrichum incanum]